MRAYRWQIRTEMDKNECKWPWREQRPFISPWYSQLRKRDRWNVYPETRNFVVSVIFYQFVELSNCTIDVLWKDDKGWKCCRSSCKDGNLFHHRHRIVLCLIRMATRIGYPRSDGGVGNGRTCHFETKKVFFQSFESVVVVASRFFLPDNAVGTEYYSLHSWVGRGISLLVSLYNQYSTEYALDMAQSSPWSVVVVGRMVLYGNGVEPNLAHHGETRISQNCRQRVKPKGFRWRHESLRWLSSCALLTFFLWRTLGAY